MPKMMLGADPEVFLLDAAGAFISSIDKIGGSKDCPRPLPIGDGFAVQEDNVALEYNIPPAQSREQLVSHISSAMSFLSEHIASMGLHFSRDSACFFPKQQLMHPRALEFGCDPDFNAWTGKKNKKPNAPDATLRSCGGHVHVGADVKDKERIVKLLDLFLAVPSQLMDNGHLRKQLYGKAGAFRPKAYGLEYRVLSNFWIFSPDTIRWVWDNTELALESDINVDLEQHTIFEAVNNNNAAAARQLIEKYNIPYLHA